MVSHKKRLRYFGGHATISTGSFGNRFFFKFECVFLVDSVINTGKTLLEVWDSGVYAACCVVNEKAVPVFGERLFAVRVSGNSFVGGEVRKQVGNVGPDTTLRLFNLV